jgi:hypothetical protein
MVRPSELGRASLRRASRDVNTKCPSTGYWHDASFDMGIAPYAPDGMMGFGRDDHPHDDPRWPARCQCGYEFVPEDIWQRRMERLMTGDGVLATHRELPVGAMFDSDWLQHKGPDGMCLTVMTPGGEWAVDAPSSGGTLWQRTGAPPNVTATPSIHFPGKYHGWLTNGLLISC